MEATGHIALVPDVENPLSATSLEWIDKSNTGG
jgi:hypothetical protein